MQTKVKVSTIYNCSLKRAFKSPILCDVSKVHTGYGFMPKVTHCTEDENWGRLVRSKKYLRLSRWYKKGGFVSTDKILERIENKYWKIEACDFQYWMLGFSKFVGEWQTVEVEKDKILIDYIHTLHDDTPLLYHLNWLLPKHFGRSIWKGYRAMYANWLI